jgi:hypothetical protein
VRQVSGKAVEERQTKPTEHEVRDDITSLESLRGLYLSERARRENVRSQLAVPVSIVSFSIFGYVSFAQYFDASRTDPVSIVIDVLMILSLALTLSAAVFLARVELIFLRVEMGDLEDMDDAEDEYQYFRRAYFRTRAQNAAAARQRARSFLLMLLALGCFIAAVALLPFHLAPTDVHGRDGSSTFGGVGSTPTNADR